MMSPFEVLVLDRLSARRPHAAAAAIRSGGVGILDVDAVPIADAPALAARQLRWLRDRAPEQAAVGLRVRASELARFADAIDTLGSSGLLVLADRLDPGTMTAFQKLRTRVLAEARSWDDVEAWRASGVELDGVIACGNEAGGCVSADSTLVLVQRLVQDGRLPVYARGGFGVLGAAGCRAAGARGVVLDDQLLLLADSCLSPTQQDALKGVGGLDTIPLSNGDAQYRVLDRPTFGGVAPLKLATRAVERGEMTSAEWQRLVTDTVAWAEPAASTWPVGQGIAFAAEWRSKYGHTGAAVRAVLRDSDRLVRQSREHPVLMAGSPLAVSHGTEFPIVQGPMTRVSDTPAFALSVAEAGGLPMLALAVLPGPDSLALLEATSARLGDRPWGVGILGFVPPDLRRAQVEAILQARPGFALIAGGRPDEATPLEAAGIATYLHVPAPALLRRFLAQGARRFVFEGRECGGHVGPLGSLTLWESVIDVLLSSPDPLDEVHVLFAGGIHDRRSASVVSAMAAPLVERGVKVGVLMGTAYLFTEEAVSSGAITARYQAETLACTRTVLLTSGLGHANRVADTPFTAEFFRRRAELLKEDREADGVRDELERLTLGRLRLASKGLLRDPRAGLVPVSDHDQLSGGIYMLGQVATLRTRACRIIELHREICDAPRPAARARARGEAAADVAIVGIAMLVPGATHHESLWRNALDLVSAVREVPAERWDARVLYDGDKGARDKSYSRWGGFCDELRFEPLSYRIPPAAMPQICSNQLLGLELTRRALADAGYEKRWFDREHAAVIFGVSETGGWNGNRLIMRSLLPYVIDGDASAAQARLPEWTGESFTGMLANITAGRIANAFDLGGPNFVLDAACASSLVAVDLAVRELESGRSSVAIVGAVDTSQTPFSYLAFSKTQALSPSGQSRVFDRTADGIVLAEGGVVMILKRYDDARRDGDRVYSIIRGTATGSDGHGLGLTAPKVDGQRRVVQRALTAAGVSAATIGMFEAHATGTPLGDRTEADTLNSVLRDALAEPGASIVGSIKSLIGHTKAVAGLVGMAKSSLALRHRVLPPHGGVTQPVDPLASPDSRLALLQAARPWLSSSTATRRAGVSAFGFGGTNGMVVLEEDPAASTRPQGADEWPAELFLFAADTRSRLAASVCQLRTELEAGAEPRMRDLAAALAAAAEGTVGETRAAVIAASRAELVTRLQELESELGRGGSPVSPHFWIGAPGDTPVGRVAFLFPGQGSQYPGMARDHALYFSEVRDALEVADRVAPRQPMPLSHAIFPAGAFGPDAVRLQQAALARADRAQPAIGAIACGITDLLARCGVEPDVLGGHSYGEIVALHMAGVMSRHDLFGLSVARGQLMARCEDGGMLSVPASREAVTAALSGIGGVTFANHNAPSQTVLSGSAAAMGEASAALASAGLRAVRLPVSGAFHSPLMHSALAPWRDALASVPMHAFERPVYGNDGGGPYDGNATAVRDRLAHHLTSSVEFVAQIERIYADGARVFIEAGPGQVVSRLVTAILGERPHVSVATDPNNGRLTGLLGAIGALFVRGVLSSPSRLFEDRDVKAIALDKLAALRPVPPTSATWWVNPLTVRPHDPRMKSGTLAPLITADSRTAGAPVVAALPAAPRIDRIPTPPLPAMSARSSSDVVAAYAAYQETMRRFLDLQERVMAGVLGNAIPADARPAPVPPAVEPLPQVETPLAPPHAPRAVVVNTPPPVPVATAPIAEPVFDASALDALIVRVASAETGYPADLLGRDLDLTGDLGIDSLRHVQIVTAVGEALPAGARDRIGGHMDRLLAARTLGDLTKVLVEAISDSAVTVAEREPAPATPSPEAASPGDGCPRSAARGFARPLELPDSPARWANVVITADVLGVAQLIAGALTSAGTRVTMIGRDELSHGAAIATAIAAGPHPDAVLHLAGLGASEAPADWIGSQIEAKSLMQLLRALPDTATPRVVAASLLGGSFGRDGHSGPGSPLTGAAVGILRAIAIERPGLRVKAVDFSAADDREAIAGRIVQELGANDDAIEVGYRASGRAVFVNVPSPLRAERSPDAVTPSGDWVVLATGGARGITGELVRTLIRPGMTVVLAGRRPLPGPEAIATAGLDETALRRALVDRAREDSERVTPAVIETRLRATLHDREIRGTVAALTGAGATVEYHGCDVRGAAAFEALIAAVYDQHGRIDAVLHGAGVIDDHLLKEKSDDSIDRVFDTKVTGALTLARSLRAEHLRLVVMFGSVSGRAGSAGQCDYAAANEVLNRVAWWMSGQWPDTRVVSINWGPWSGVGMASPAVQAILRARGILPIAPAEGGRFFLNELECGSRTDVEVIAGAGPWRDAAPAAAEAQDTGLRISRA